MTGHTLETVQEVQIQLVRGNTCIVLLIPLVHLLSQWILRNAPQAGVCAVL